ncbi:MAG: cytochrome c [Bdellovibrionales bacterium]|nr:cytochrome c [Bdellovibrionales bacterium]
MKRLIFSASVLAVLTACNGGSNKTNIELVQNMMDQPMVKSQGWIPEEGDKTQMRVPPKHTVSRHQYVYKYADDIAGADRQPNPLAGQMGAPVLEAGRKAYDIYCAVCHGHTGAGDGSVAEKMAVKPRNLINADAKSYTDGRIFHAITSGRGVMGSYASQIPDVETRWKIVNYIRTLQK